VQYWQEDPATKVLVDVVMEQATASRIPPICSVLPFCTAGVYERTESWYVWIKIYLKPPA